VISERRNSLLQKIGLPLGDLREVADIWQHLVTTLSAEQIDIAFACFYAYEQNDLALKGTTANVDAAWHTMQWPFPQENEPVAPIFLNSLQHAINPLPKSYWPESPVEAIMMPISSLQGEPFGWCVFGLNPRYRYDREYRIFLDALTRIIFTAFNTVESFKREREKAEALAELDKAKTTFFNNISHELRTPLTLMLGPLEEVMQENSLPSAVAKNAALAYRNTERLYKLVNQLLEFTRLEAGRVDASFKAVDIKSATAEIARTFEHAMQKAGLQFVVELAPIDKPVFIDFDYWEKIVLNLLSNAFKYTLAGSITLKQFARDQKLVLQVTDSGIGIPRDDINSIFDRFHRVASTVGRSFEGTGIGLSLVREMVKAHDGEISVESELGVGTTFTVAIPFGNKHLHPGQLVKNGTHTGRSLSRAFAEEANAMLTDTQAMRPGDTAARKTILVTDDNQDLRAYIASLLHNEFHVLEASTGIQALALIHEYRHIDLVISDIMMPVMDGKELVRRLKADRSTHDIPVVLLSARAGEEAKIDGLDAGADDYLSKPFSSRELISRVRALLRTASIREESENLIRNLFEQAPVSLSVFSGPDFVIDEMNAMALKDIGRERQAVIGKPLVKAIPETEGQDVIDILKSVYESGERYVAIEHLVSFIHDGERRDQFFNFVYQPVSDGHSGVRRIMAMANDITESVKNRRAVERREQHFRLIAEASPVMMWMAGDNSLVTYFNARWLQFTGRTLEQELGHGWTEGIHPDDHARCVDIWTTSFNEQRELYLEYRLRYHDGSYRWISDNGVPWFDSQGVFQGYIGGCIDIHERIMAAEVLEQKVALRTEELRKKNQELEQFAYISSHDLQEPLRKIRTFAGRTRDTADNRDSVISYVDRIDSAATRMSNLIRDILGYSKLGSDEKFDESVDLSSLLSQVTGDLELAIEEKKAAIASVDLPVVAGNRAQLYQLFYNLINNSLKFSKDQPQIVVSSHIITSAELPQKVVMPKETYFKISFTDNGIGFEQKYAEKIFGLFQRLHGRDAQGGTGIGLALVRKVVENHGGLIIATSQPGAGAQFDVYLPTP
jgi:PAS domain S-box-containing protein